MKKLHKLWNPLRDNSELSQQHLEEIFLNNFCLICFAKQCAHVFSDVERMPDLEL